MHLLKPCCLPVYKLSVNLFKQIFQDDVFQNLARDAGQGYWTVAIDTDRSC